MASSNEDIKKIQTLQQQILVLEEYLKLYKQRMIEINVALDSLQQSKEKGQTEAFQLLGANIMIKRPIDEIIDELKEERDMLAEKIKNLEKELSDLKTSLKSLLPQKAGG